VACIYDNWQSIFDDAPDACNAQRRDGRSPADSNQELQYSSKVAGKAAANTPREVLSEILWQLLQSLTFKHNPITESGYYHILYADGNLRLCTPDFAA